MPKEMKRVKLIDAENIPSTYKNAECRGCKTLVDKMTNLQDTVEQSKETILSFISSQNTAVMTALADQKVVIDKLVRQDAASLSIKSSFPLLCAEDLTRMDERVVPENRQFFITTLRSLIQNSVRKNILKVFSSELLMESNIDGTHGKKSLKDHKNLYSVFLESIISLTSNDEPDTQLRKAIQLHKKRVFQKSGMAKVLKAAAAQEEVTNVIGIQN